MHILRYSTSTLSCRVDALCFIPSSVWICWEKWNKKNTMRIPWKIWGGEWSMNLSILEWSSFPSFDQYWDIWNPKTHTQDLWLLVFSLLKGLHISLSQESTNWCMVSNFSTWLSIYQAGDSFAVVAVIDKKVVVGSVVRITVFVHPMELIIWMWVKLFVFILGKDWSGER